MISPFNILVLGASLMIIFTHTVEKVSFQGLGLVAYDWTFSLEQFGICWCSHKMSLKCICLLLSWYSINKSQFYLHFWAPAAIGDNSGETPTPIPWPYASSGKPTISKFGLFFSSFHSLGHRLFLHPSYQNVPGLATSGTNKWKKANVRTQSTKPRPSWHH